MKAPAPIPKNIRIIDRESFLASVEKRGHLLLRAQTENPNNHLLVIFSDPEEKYAVVVETGPNAEHTDLRQASRSAPQGLAVRYIVPCAQCPPYAIPKGLAQTQLPQSLSLLLAPPAGFGEGVEEAAEPEEPSAPEEEAPAPAPVRVTRATVPPINPAKTKTAQPAPAPAPAPAPEPAPEPVVKHSFAVTTKAPPTLSSEVAPTGAAPEPATLAALLSRSLQDIEKTLAERDGELRRREDSIRDRELTIEKERKLLEEEAGRISSGVDNREQALLRREKELQSLAESLVRSMRELDDLRRKIESFSAKPFTGGR